MTAIVIGLLLFGGLVVISVTVQREAGYVLESLGGKGTARALVLYHPSRDAHFSDDLSIAFSEGLKAAGLVVDRATLTSETPADPRDYTLIGVVSNTYYWTPDRPTLRYLKRARFDGVAAVGLIGGAGATGRSERLLGEALRQTWARVIQTRSFWIFRPNDERRLNEPNRRVALDLARQLGMDTGKAVLATMTNRM